MNLNNMFQPLTQNCSQFSIEYDSTPDQNTLLKKSISNPDLNILQNKIFQPDIFFKYQRNFQSNQNMLLNKAFQPLI